MIAAATRDSATEQFGRRLKAAREAKGLTQVQLSDRSSIPLNMIRMYEQGRSLPSAERASVLCHLLDVGIGDLIPVDWRDH